MADLVGTNLGQYRILAQIGLGGMATVYKAYQPGVDRLVALKVLPHHYARDALFVARFKREAQIIARLEHPGIIPIFDFGEQSGTAYLAMRYLQAGTVKDILRAGPLPVADAARLVTQVASALDYAHSQGIVHRDVKPSNVLVDRQGDAYLTDFGIAKVLESTVELTGPALLGTPAYMAPEQTLGKTITPQTDVYSLGVMLYEMVAGRPPFEADTPMAVALKHVHEPLPLPTTIKPDLPPAIEQVIVVALAKAPNARYQQAGELARALQDVTGSGYAPASARLIERASAAATNLGAEEITFDLRQELDRQKNAERLKLFRRWTSLAAGAIMILALSLAAIWLGTQVNSIQAQSLQTGTALAIANFAATESARPPTLTPEPTPNVEVTQTTQALADQLTATQQVIKLTLAEVTRSAPQTLAARSQTWSAIKTQWATDQIATSASLNPTQDLDWLVNGDQINHIVINATSCVYLKIGRGPVIFNITVEIWDTSGAAAAGVRDAWPSLDVSGRRPLNRFFYGPTQNQATGKWSYEYIYSLEGLEPGTYVVTATGSGINAQCTVVAQD